MFRKLIATQFKRPTGLFGRFTANLMIKNNHHNYETMIRELNLQPGEKLLEIGYGPGIGLHTIAEQCADCMIYGLDFSSLMYKKACEHNKAFIDKGNMILEYGDFLQKAVAGKNFDKIFCLNVIYFWDELNTPFAKVFSLLKQGGMFCIYMASKDSLIEMKTPDVVFNKYSIEEVEGTLKSVGFADVSNRYEKGFHIKAIK
jgi:ubiquinone/menaquinone biosynthesis C-methylase UbiE